MDSFLKLVGDYSIGNLVTIVLAILFIIDTIHKLLLKLFVGHDKSQDIDNALKLVKEHNMRLDKHDDDIKQLRLSIEEDIKKQLNERDDKINSKIDELLTFNKSLEQATILQIRHYIVTSCNEALIKKGISTSELKSLEEMYEMYKDVLHQNSYVTTLMLRVRKLNIIDYDIND